MSPGRMSLWAPGDPAPLLSSSSGTSAQGPQIHSPVPRSTERNFAKGSIDTGNFTRTV